MENLLRGCAGVSIYLDDILVTGETKEEHLKNLCLVLTKLKAAGLKLNKAKCKFLQERIEYLGYAIDAEGLHPTEEKVKAIKEAPKPQNVTELRSFLGIINYYSRFLPQLSTKLAPLYSLLHKNNKWAWKEEQEKAFHMAKVALQSNSLLVHYDPNKEIVLSCDASPYGIGAVLSHVMEDGSDRPIAYASRTLTNTECKFSQLEKEGLAIVFGTKRFHTYLYGRFFHIESDHQPLSYLFNENKEIPRMVSSRIQRWALTLSAYQYSIRYKPGKLIGNADALSRLPRPVTTTLDCTPEDLVQLVNHISTTTVKSDMIKNWTCKDPLLSLVQRYTLSGWPSTVEDSLKPFHTRRNELSTLDGCVLWGSRIIIPPKGRQLLLNDLHETHPGCSRMKALARSYIWWPKMDSEIEEVVKKCTICQEQRSSPPVAPLHPWEWPEKPWSRLHLDFAGPFMGHMFLVIVDAHSKWLDAHIMPNITSIKTIEILRKAFSIHGIPQKIVTDNGPSFVSAEFEEFLGNNGIKHNTSAPYHPSTNGLAERGVQTLKKGLKVIQGSNLEEKLCKFLFNYRITPHTTTGISPSELLMGRRLRSRLDLIYPNISRRVESSQQRQKESHDNTKPVRRFEIGDMVYAEDFRVSRKSKWLPGMVSKITGPLSYVIELSGGGLIRRHIDNLRSRQAQGSTSVDEFDMGLDISTVETNVQHSQPLSTASSESVRDPTPNDNSVRRSSRPSRPPNWYSPIWN